MRDFNSGNIQGDVIINDNSNTSIYIPLYQCSNEELVVESHHRKHLLLKERSRKREEFIRFLSISVFLMIIAAGFYWYKGSIDIASLLIGIASIIIGIRSVRSMEIPTEFEKRQLAALNEINNLLRERDVL